MNRPMMIVGASALAAFLALAGCGKKGDLEAPVGAPAPAAASQATPGCYTPPAVPEEKPIDANAPTNSPTGNTNRMPDLSVPPC